MAFWKSRLDRNYISELDQFLMEFDRKPEASSSSRRKEEIQYERIFRLRDNPLEPKFLPIWEKF